MVLRFEPGEPGEPRGEQKQEPTREQRSTQSRFHPLAQQKDPGDGQAQGPEHESRAVREGAVAEAEEQDRQEPREQAGVPALHLSSLSMTGRSLTSPCIMPPPG